MTAPKKPAKPKTSPPPAGETDDAPAPEAAEPPSGAAGDQFRYTGGMTVEVSTKPPFLAAPGDVVTAATDQQATLMAGHADFTEVT